MPNNVPNDAVTPSLIHVIDSTCDRFERAWLAGERPRIEDYLKSSGYARDTNLFRQLLLLDIDYRAKKGEPATEEEYGNRFPEHASVIASAFRHAEGGGPLQATADWTKGSTGSEERQSTPRTLTGIQGAFGRFQVFEPPLGQGAFGTVYRALDTRLGREVALKVPRAGILREQEDVDRFMREARSAALLRHPNIVPIYDAGEIDGVYYITSGLVSGHTLRQAIKQGDYSSVRDAAHLIAILAGALHYAHNKGIIHRDIKPENVMIDEAGEPHIMDFGLAHRDEDDVLRTQEGLRMGTPAYMSPEQHAGNSRDADARSDLWSLGVMLYEMLTGKRPFQGGSDVEIAIAVGETSPASPRTLKPEVLLDLETICLKCLAKSADERYPSCQHLADELSRWLRHEPIQARRVGRLVRLARWYRRKPALAFLASASTLLLVVAVGISAVSWATVSRHKQDAIRLGSQKDAIAKREQLAHERVRDLADKKDELLKRESAERQRAQQLNAKAVFENALSKCSRESADRGLVALARSVRIAEELGALDIATSARLQLAGWSRECHQLLNVVFTTNSSVDIQFTADGSTLVEAMDIWIRFWDIHAERTLVPEIRFDSNIRAFRLSQDGKGLVSVTADGRVQTWDTRTRTEIAPSRHLNADSLSPSLDSEVTFSLDGSLLASERADHSIEIWKLDKTPELLATLQIAGDVRSTMFSADNQILVTVSKDNGVEAWNVWTGKPTGFKVDGYDCRLSPTGTSVAVGRGSNVQLYDLRTGERRGIPLRVPVGLSGGGIRDIAFSADGQRLAAASRSGTVVWDLTTWEQIGPILEGSARLCVFSHDDSIVATSGSDSTLRIWALSDRTLPSSVLYGQSTLALAVSADSTKALTGHPDGLARLWDLATAEQCASALHHNDEVTAVAFDPSGTLVITGSRDGKGQLWDATSGKPIGLPLELTGRVSAVGFSHDGSIVATAAGPIAFWRTLNQEVLLRHGGTERFFGFHPDGASYLTRSADRIVRLRELATGIATGQQLSPQKDAFWKVAFTGDGKSLLTGTGDGVVQLWDAATFSPKGQAFQHPSGVTQACLSSDGKIVLTRCDDGKLRLWEAATSTLIGAPLDYAPRLTTLTFTSRRNEFLTASDAEARVWRCPLIPSAVDWRRLAVWTEAMTGLELDEHGTYRVLDTAAWRERIRALDQLGGPPIVFESTARPDFLTLSSEGLIASPAAESVQIKPSVPTESTKGNRASRAQDGAVLWFASGRHGTIGKISQVDWGGHFLHTFKLPSTPSAIDVFGGEIAVAMPEVGRVALLDERGKLKELPESNLLPHPIAVAFSHSSGNLILGDNDADVILESRREDEFRDLRSVVTLGPGDARRQNVSVKVGADEVILLGSSEPQGVFSFPRTGAKSLGEPVLTNDGTVAVEHSSNRWAVTQPTEVRVFKGQQLAVVISLPSNMQHYGVGRLAFAPNGELVTILRRDKETHVFAVDTGEGEDHFTRLFTWHGDQINDFCIAPQASLW